MAIDRIIRVKIREELFRKFKVYCAIRDISMTDMTNKIVKDFVDIEQRSVKIINTEKSE